jgi:hypothetical protein
LIGRPLRDVQETVCDPKDGDGSWIAENEAGAGNERSDRAAAILDDQADPRELHYDVDGQHDDRAGEKAGVEPDERVRDGERQHRETRQRHDVPAARAEEAVAARRAVPRVAIEHAAVRERPEDQRQDRPARAEPEDHPVFGAVQLEQTNGGEHTDRHRRRFRHAREPSEQRVRDACVRALRHQT